MKIIRIIKANTNWWKKYYKVTEPSIESKEAIEDYKKFVKSLGNKVRGL